MQYGVIFFLLEKLGAKVWDPEKIVIILDDEYDFDETADDIIPDLGGGWRVKATTELTHFDESFRTRYAEGDQATVGGLVGLICPCVLSPRHPKVPSKVHTKHMWWSPSVTS